MPAPRSTEPKVCKRNASIANDGHLFSANTHLAIMLMSAGLKSLEAISSKALWLQPAQSLNQNQGMKMFRIDESELKFAEVLARYKAIKK